MAALVFTTQISSSCSRHLENISRPYDYDHFFCTFHMIHTRTLLVYFNKMYVVFETKTSKDFQTTTSLQFGIMTGFYYFQCFRFFLMKSQRPAGGEFLYFSRWTHPVAARGGILTSNSAQGTLPDTKMSNGTDTRMEQGLI